jgi:hypothetical protein
VLCLRGHQRFTMVMIPSGRRKLEDAIRREDVVNKGLDMREEKASATSTPRTTTRKAELHDAKVDVKVALSGLWISMLFVFAYVDIFGFWRSDVINGALAGEVPGPGFTINQTYLVLTTIYVLIPSVMVVVSLMAPARINRTANIVASLIYAASVVVSVIGETWTYFIVGSVVEVMLLLAIARIAWTWPRRSSQGTSADA